MGRLDGFIWVYMDLYGFIWIHMDLYGFIWVYMGLYGWIERVECMYFGERDRRNRKE
jgi:hypothetical protein